MYVAAFIGYSMEAVFCLINLIDERRNVMFEKLIESVKSDIESVKRRDPAARSTMSALTVNC